MTRTAGVVVFTARPGQGEEAAKRIAAALPAVEKEAGTMLWLVLRSKADADRIFLVDLFDSDESLDAHMTGRAAAQIFATVPELLAAEPELHPSTVISSKPAS
ncbi:MAG: antibiotic biosynthesis monooxygenase [Rhodanobacter sp.]|nr:antibiotic biosynthesis monooxygenase [Rhodanobacter sp.]